MKNTIKFKAMLRIAGIIAMVAVIMIGMAACGDNSKTYTVSLNKVDDKTFTVTVEGGIWKNAGILRYVKFNDLTATYTETSNQHDIVEQRRGSYFDDVLTSDNVTCTLQDDYENLKGTVYLNTSVFGEQGSSAADYIVDGDIIYDTVLIKPGKGSITF